MKTHTLLISLSALGGLVHGLGAAWSEVSTFDDASALALITDVQSVEGSNARSEVANGVWGVYPGDLFELNSNLYAMLDLGVDLKAASESLGGPVTIYFEVMQPTVDDGAGGTRKALLDTVWGLSNVDPAVVADAENRYDSFNVMQRIVAGTDAYEGRNGGSYEGTGEVFQADVFYSIWIVVDFDPDFGNFYEAYIQGGQWTEQTRLSTAATEGLWFFRKNPGPTDTVDYFLVALSRGNSVQGEKGKDPTFFDNIYLDTSGQNLSSPVVATPKGPGVFSELDMVDGGWVDSGSFMGWVWTANYPWVYVSAIGNWAYISEGDGTLATGKWAYVARE